MERIIECVPNFSEGRNMEVINSIVETIEKSGGVKILLLIAFFLSKEYFITILTFYGRYDIIREIKYRYKKIRFEKLLAE